MMHNLPFEIYQRIGFYLSQESCLQCIFVNHLFHDAFIRCLFQSVSIGTRNQFDSFLNQTRYHCFVQHLVIGPYALEGGDIEKMKLSFSRLGSIQLDLSVHDCLYYTSYGCARQIAYTFIDAFFPHHLKSIMIDLGYDSHSDANILKDICMTCPLLEDFSIRCSYLEQSSPERQEPIRIDSIKELKLTLNNVHTCWEICQWLSGIGECYPNLHSLKIRTEMFNQDNDFNLSSWYGTTYMLDQQQRISIYSHFLAKCPRLTHLETANILPDQDLCQQLYKRENIHLTNTSNMPITSRLYLETCREYPNYFSVITSLDICYWHNTKTCRPMEIIGNACPNLSRLVLRPNYIHLVDPLWIDVVLHCFPQLKYLELNEMELQNKRSNLCLDTQHPLEEIHVNTCTLLDGCFDCVCICCLQLKHICLNRAKFHSRYDKVSLDLQQQKLCSISIQYAYVSNLLQAIQIFHVQSQIRSEWFVVPGYQGKDEFLSTIPKKVKKLNETDAFLLDTVMKQHPLSWQDLAIQTYWFTSDLLEDIDLLEAFSAGYLEIKCQSIDTLCINDKCVF
ncbi:hypothetical protein BD560DRAFT_393048 [Blakeslea trispora]|nr:hypothetical protein BD560DRAFT_393048 [Blakeslea trispora]